jgi:hypothetical protein
MKATTQARIIDRDCEFYDAMVSQHLRDRANCASSDEPRHETLAVAARAAATALAAYRHAIDMEKT